ncbi:MAG: HAD hydrolase-like protein [Victivallales bacterium]|nr:HAD hydrolase-like protein [Victivallales bacterium]
MKVEGRFLKWWSGNLGDYSAIFFDIDGTLISGGRALPGAADVIKLLRDSRFPFCLLTNDGNHSLEEKSGILNAGGLDISVDEIVSCCSALKYLAIREGYQGKRFFAMGELGNPDFAELAGMRVVRDISKIHFCAGVIVGEGCYNWQSNINAVVNFFISRGGDAVMIVPNPDSYWPNGSNGEIGIGAGGKARFVCTILREYGIKVKPLYLGKPYTPVYRCALRHLSELHGLPGKITRKRILMLGDSLFSDIRGARRAGFSSGLLLTGITNSGHVRRAPGHSRPDMIFRAL